MKLKLLFFTLCSSLAFTAGAVKLNVTVQNFSFTPNDATINLGDTVVFTWINGEHTTTSTTIPAGAVAWDQHMTSTSTSFTYVPAIAGVYHYQCTPHAAMGHIGKFTVNGGTGIGGLELSKTVFDLYPNPATGMLNVAVKNNGKAATVAILDVTGKQVMTGNEIKSELVQMNVSSLAKGTYFVRVIRDGNAYVRKFTIAP